MDQANLDTEAISPHQESTSDSPNRGLYSYCSTLYRICQEENIKIQFLSNNWVIRLEKGKQIHFIVGHKFDLNPHGVGIIADDKCATYAALTYRELPAVPHALVYDFANIAPHARGRNDLTYVEKLFDEYRQHIVLKPNCGSGGRQVYQINEKTQLLPTLLELFANNRTVALCPFYNILHEHRVVVLDGDIRIAYTKVLPDSKSWKFNLQQGATSEPIPALNYSKITTLARKAAKAIGLRFGSVDIIETAEHDLLVLEINSGVMLDKYIQQHPDQYERAYTLYRNAIRKMFLE